MEYVIEFRSGSFFQTLAADNGGPHETARRFGSEEAATRFMDANDWIYANGGMVVPVDPHEKLRSIALAAIEALRADALRIARERPHSDYEADALAYNVAILAIRRRAHR